MRGELSKRVREASDQSGASSVREERIVKDKEQKQTITLRLNPAEKERIRCTARRCGLSTTEYMKQRALHYEPNTVPPEALFHLQEAIGALQDLSSSSETDEKINAVLEEIIKTLMLPGKEGRKTWQSQDSGP